MEDLQFSMGRQYGHPSCLHRRQNVVLTNPQMHLSFFLSLSANPFHFLLCFFFFSCMKMQLCGWQSAHCLPVFEQLACPGPVPDAVLFIYLFIYFFLPASLYTSDEQVVASEQIPAQKSREGRRPGRSMKADTMLYVQSHRWIRLGRSIYTVEHTCRHMHIHSETGVHMLTLKNHHYDKCLYYLSLIPQTFFSAYNIIKLDGSMKHIRWM